MFTVVKKATMLLISYAILTGCGMSSYYEGGFSFSDIDDRRVHEQIKLTKVIFLPGNNADRIMKDELLKVMQRIDINDFLEYRYLMLISTRYNTIPIMNPIGVPVAYHALLYLDYIIFDLGKIHDGVDDLNIDSDDQLITGVTHVGTQEAPPTAPVVTGNIKNNDEARKDLFDKRSNFLKKDFKVMTEGSVLSIEQSTTNVILLYADYVEQNSALNLAGKSAAHLLLYQLIRGFGEYVQPDYSIKENVHTDPRTDFDILVDRARNKIAPYIVEHFSITALRDRILNLTKKNDNDKPLEQDNNIKYY